MQNILKYLNGDRVIWIITLLMLAFSLVSVYSFVPILIKIEGGTASKYLFKHIIYVGMSLGAMYWVHKKKIKYISQLSKFLFYLSVALLIFTFFFGAKINNAGRWVRIPFVGLTFQSSDFARLALIIYLSRLLVKKRDLLDKWKEGILPIFMPIIIICGLIVKDNFSTAAILFLISLILLFIGRIPWKKFITIIVGGISLLFLIIVIHKTLPTLNLLPRYETWENRFINHINDDNNVIANAQSLNAQLAIYSGSLFGKGVGDGELKEYLPEAYADFYYASFVEEFGLLSSIILIMLYLILLYRIIRIGLKSNELFDTYVCIGIGILILSQSSVNMLVCTGLLPVTGQNMPLLAMGGSALMITCISLGIVQSIANKQYEK